MKQSFDNYNELHIRHDDLSGCTFVIALNTKDGDSCSGGTRMKIYPSLVHGISDAINLTKNMSKKCKIIGREFNGCFSGGKGVIIGDPLHQKTPDMLMRYGEFVHTLGGRFVTGTDININNEDAKFMAQTTPYIDGLDTGSIGDTAVGTAYGILYSIREVLNLYCNRSDLSGIRICVQGLGSVGMNLIELLNKEGAELFVTDLSQDKINQAKNTFNVKAVFPDEIYKVECDIFSPNAIGGVLNEENINMLKCRFIIGSANNQLSLGDGEGMNYCTYEKGGKTDDPIKQKIEFLDHLLQHKKIIYLPDYVANIGGVYSSICEQTKRDRSFMLDTLEKILDREINYLFKLSINNNLSLLGAAELQMDTLQ